MEVIDVADAVLEESTDDEVMAALSAGDEWAVRALLARIAKTEREQARLRGVLNYISGTYGERIGVLDQQAARYRESVRNFLLVNGGKSVSFPDLGTAYLTSKGGKAKVTDAGELEAWWDEFCDGDGGRHKIAYEETFVPKHALNAALERYTVDADRAKLVDRETGEVIDVPGVTVTPREKTLAVRPA